MLARIPGHRERVASVTLSDDARWLATASWDGTLRIADMDWVDASLDDVRARVQRWGLDD